MRSDNHYARMSDEYGPHNDHSRYPNAYAHKKNPNIIESYDPNEVKPKIGEGAGGGATIGAHYRDPTTPAARRRPPQQPRANAGDHLEQKSRRRGRGEAAARAGGAGGGDERERGAGAGVAPAG